MKTSRFPSLQPALTGTMLVLACLISASYAARQFGSWPSHAHGAQHTGVSSVATQPLNKIHWQTPVDLAPPTGVIPIHYGSPLVTAANTVVVPVKTGPNSFRVEGHNGTTGALIWTQDTGYSTPANRFFIPGLGAALFGDQLFVPDTAGRILVRQSPDSAVGAVSYLYFYGAQNYAADPHADQQNVLINTPITTDAQGNVYFGFE